MSFIKARIAGVWKLVDTINVFKVRVAGAWKDVTFLRVYETTGNPPQSGWRDAWLKNAAPPPAPPPPPVDPPPVVPPVVLNVTISPTAVHGSRLHAGLVTTSPAVASVTGGTGPYIYSWTKISWGSIVPVINSPNAAGTTFSETLPFEEQTENAVFQAYAQDSLGNVGSAQVSAQFITTGHVGGGGGSPIP